MVNIKLPFFLDLVKQTNITARFIPNIFNIFLPIADKKGRENVIQSGQLS